MVFLVYKETVQSVTTAIAIHAGPDTGKRLGWGGVNESLGFCDHSNWFTCRGLPYAGLVTMATNDRGGCYTQLLQ